MTRHSTAAMPLPSSQGRVRARHVATRALLVACVACAGEQAPAHTAAHHGADTARRIAPLGAARWTRVEEAGDSTLRDAVAIAADESTVYVVADAGRRLVAIEGDRGAARWTLPAAGDAPLAPLGATAIVRTPLGSLALLDGRARLIRVVGAEGRVRESITLPADGEPTRLCARERGGFLVAGGDPQGRLVALGPDGAFEWTLVQPWPGADTLGALRLQTVLASTPGGDACLAALRLGLGFVRLRASTPPVMSAHPYREPVAIPAVRTLEQREGTTTTIITTLDDAPAAAADVAVAGPTALVAFEGATAERRRLVDLYALADGAYRGSLLHPSPIVAIAAWESRLYVLHRSRGRFALAAYDVPALRDGVVPSATARPLAAARAERSR